MDEQGLVTVQLFKRAGNDVGPRFSPDHTKIAFTEVTAGQPSTAEIWVINIYGYGTGLQRLTSNARIDEDPNS